MVCSGIENLTNSGISGIMSFPTSCDYYFYAKVLGAIFIILTLILYNNDKRRYLKADLISAVGVSSIATIFIALIGTLLDIIQRDIFILTLVIGIIFITIWLLKK